MAELKSLIVNGVTRLNNTSYATDLYANKFIKNSSSDSYVLLGGGGHKLISDFANASHTHNYVSKTGDTMTGTLTFSGSVGINFPMTSEKITRSSVGTIHTGADGASSTDANLRFGSWYGFGWYPTISGQTIPQGENAMWLNVRTGYLYTRGGFVKNGSSDSYVLLGGGGHKAISDFATGTHTHDSRYGVVAKGYTTTAGTKYVLLGTIPASTSSTYDTFNIVGDIGDWGSYGKQHIDVTVGGRDGIYFKGFVSDIKASSYDIGVDNSTRKIYVILYTQYTEYNLHIFSNQSTVEWTGALVTLTNPDFTLLSASTTINKFSYGSFLGNAASATNVNVTQHTTNNVNYPLIWSNQNNTNNSLSNQLYKSYSDLYYNPSTKSVTTGRFISNVATGTSPFAVSSTTAVTNLNADMLDGLHAASFSQTNHTHGNYVTLDTLQTISGVKNFTNTIRIVGTVPTPAWNTPARIEFAENDTSSQAVSLVYTSYDSYRATAGIKLLGNQGGEWFESPMFVKTGSNSSQLLRGDGGTANFNWSGQGGQPTWLWGGNSQHTYYVYNPSNFSVNYANSAGNADTVDGYHASSFVIDAGANYTNTIYSIPSKRVFSGLNMPDAPKTGWVSGLSLGSNWNNDHYQHYLIEIDSRWYASRTASSSKMTNWQTFAYLSDLDAYSKTTHTHSEYVTLATAQTITGAKTFNSGTWNIASNESNAITTQYWNNNTWGNITSGNYGVRNSIRFNWYSTAWCIGNIRGGSTDSYGFGIGKISSSGTYLEPSFRVNDSAGYIYNSLILTAGNYSSTLDGRYVLKAGDTMTGNLTFSGTVGLNFDTATAKITRGGGNVIHTGADGASSSDANLRFGSWYGIGWYPTISGQSVPQGENAMWLNVRSGYLYVRSGFVKNGSSDSYVLLGGGGHKSVSDFAIASHNHTVYQHTTNNIDYPIIWSDQYNANNVNANQFYKSYSNLTYNPANSRINNWAYRTVGENSNRGIDFNNTGMWLNSIAKQLILRDGGFRFGGSTWDWNVWAGLKYTHGGSTTTNIIDLSVAEGTYINANTPQYGVLRHRNTSVEIYPNNTGNYSQGIRIHPYGSWSLIMLGDASLGAFTGSSTNSYLIGNETGNFYINKGGSNDANATRFWIRSSGGFTLGNTNNNSYTLEVGGDVRLSSGWLRTTGAAGWYSESYGGGWYMSDSTYVRTHNNKKVYSSGYCHSTVNSDNYVLLAGGGYNALSSLSSSHNHDSRYGIIAKGTTSSTGTKYILLGTIPVSSNGTYDSFHIIGNIGSWSSSGKQHIDVTVGGRDGINFRGFVSNISAGSYDIGVDSSTRKVYIIMKDQYTEYDLHIFSNQSTIEWTGAMTSLTNPNFTLLSASTAINKFSSGSFLGNASSATNADQLDGIHATGLFTTFAASGNSTSITIGGTNKTLVIPYATNSNTSSYSNYLNINPSGFSTANYGSYGGIIQDTDGPESGQWTNKLKILHGNTSSYYYTELAMSFTGTEAVYYRSKRGGTLSAWKRLAYASELYSYVYMTVSSASGWSAGNRSFVICGTLPTTRNANTVYFVV